MLNEGATHMGCGMKVCDLRGGRYLFVCNYAPGYVKICGRDSQEPYVLQFRLFILVVAMDVHITQITSTSTLHRHEEKPTRFHTRTEALHRLMRHSREKIEVNLVVSSLCHT